MFGSEYMSENVDPMPDGWGDYIIWLAVMAFAAPFVPAMQIVTAGLELNAWQWRELERWAR